MEKTLQECASMYSILVFINSYTPPPFLKSFICPCPSHGNAVELYKCLHIHQEASGNVYVRIQPMYNSLWFIQSRLSNVARKTLRRIALTPLNEKSPLSRRFPPYICLFALSRYLGRKREIQHHTNTSQEKQ